MMHLIGDIGNTKTKVCILDKKFKIIKKLNVDTLKIKNQYYFKKIIFSFIKGRIVNKIIAKYEQFFSNLNLYKFINFKLKSQKLLLN